MMSTKNVEAVIAPPSPHFVGDGFRVHGFIPGVPRLTFQRMDPFLVMDYNSKFYFPPSSHPRGVGVHPHKGFETVTLAYKGSVAHHDSSGGGGVIQEGDVQWMTAGKGVLHKEFHEEEFSRKGGEFQMVQLWVNLPAKDKSHEPRYQSVTKENVGKYALPNGGGIVEVVAGNYKDTRGPAKTFSPVHLYNAKLHQAGEALFNFPKNYTTAALVIEGSIVVNNQKEVPVNQFVLFGNEGEEFTIKASEEAVILIMSGEPLKEPIAAHGPFVMNSQEELVQAFEDFNQGKFGTLE